MAEADDDAAVGEAADHRGRDAFGRQRDEQRFEAERQDLHPRSASVIVRISGGSCAPLPLRRQERSLEMEAEDSRARVRAIACLTAATACAVISGESVMKVGSIAVVPKLAWAAQIVRTPSARRRVVEQHAAAAIDLRVDEARRQHAAVRAVHRQIAGTSAIAAPRRDARTVDDHGMCRDELVAVEDLRRRRGRPGHQIVSVTLLQQGRRVRIVAARPRDPLDRRSSTCTMRRQELGRRMAGGRDRQMREALRAGHPPSATKTRAPASASRARNGRANRRRRHAGRNTSTGKPSPHELDRAVHHLGGAERLGMQRRRLLELQRRFHRDRMAEPRPMIGRSAPRRTARPAPTNRRPPPRATRWAAPPPPRPARGRATIRPAPQPRRHRGEAGLGRGDAVLDAGLERDGEIRHLRRRRGRVVDDRDDLGAALLRGLAIATRSGLRPDCEITSTTAPCRRSGAW